jgi:DNA-directed RNA polymerase specialized sigma24 family protein
MLGIAVGTCKAQLHRARQLLGARLAAGESSA